MITTRMFHIFIFIIIFCASQSVADVCPYNTKNCTCNKTIYCTNLQSIPPLDPATNITVVDIRFMHGNITTVSKNSLPPALTRITFYGHPLINISEDAFETSSTTLEELHIQNATFHEIPTALLQLQNLTVFEISYTELDFSEQDIHVLKHLSGSLRSLQLSGVGLSTWPSWISSFSSLTEASLDHNRIVFISEDAFTSFEDTLTELDLSNNELTQIPPTANLSRLTGLYLSQNKISEITSDTLSSSLKTLFLDTNSITEITDASFPNNSQLKSLILLFNPISTITPSAFKPLINITDLRLSLKAQAGIPEAVTSLTTLTSFSNSNLFSCVCPPPENIVRWYKSYNGTLHLTASCIKDGAYIDYADYLSGHTCGSTSPTTVKSIITTPNNSAASRKCWEICVYVYMLGLLTSFFNRLPFYL